MPPPPGAPNPATPRAAAGTGHALALGSAERRHRELLHPLDRLLRHPRRDHELHAALVVLRRVVVPVGVGHDLTRNRRDRLLVSEHAALDLDPGDELLDE